MIQATEALQRLRDGNRRFIANEMTTMSSSQQVVPAELVFDQGFGDLFVIRVAGNIVAPSQVGSVEFAASRFGTRLVAVVGHSKCGAVGATLEEMLGRSTTESHNLKSIVDCVRPSLETLVATGNHEDFDTLLGDAVRANVRASVHHLRHGSELLERLIREEGLMVVGAEYSLDSGIVTFFDGDVEDAG
jgi:carbonic anhydrase